jgi:sugar phosphate permease
MVHRNINPNGLVVASNVHDSVFDGDTTLVGSLGTAISSAHPAEGGLSSGIVNTSYQVGSAIGLAAMTALAAAYGADEPGASVALTNGFSAAFLGSAAIALTGALIAAATLRSSVPQPPAP